jgi:hypothetical protein
MRSVISWAPLVWHTARAVGFLAFKGSRPFALGFLLSVTALGAQAATGCGSRTGLRWDDSRDAAPPPPVVCPVYDIDRVRVGEVARVDLLFVIDNSASMTDKQDLLKDAIPPLVERLANPLCVDGSEPPNEQSVASPSSPCPPGFDREFEPINDIHIGIISSSLGGRGGQICANAPEDDDHARLMGTLGRGASLDTYQGLGFLAWDPDQELEPPGDRDIDVLGRKFQDMLGRVGETGCGFEAPLEAMYRFLVDPKPPASVELGRCGAEPCTQRVGTDSRLLAQRAAFLRPDSLVAVVLLSDEDDCSGIDAGEAWLMTTAFRNGREFRLPRSTSTCKTDPNSPCCRTCVSSVTPAGCVSTERDPDCAPGGGFYDELGDSLNLRCFDQKRRFGIDFLYPTARYSVGLSELEICPDSVYRDGDCLCRPAIARAQKLGLPAPPCTRSQTGTPVRNPLFRNLTGDAAFGREPSQVFFAAIVGVPWQDIATRESLEDPAVLEYLSADELASVDPALGMSRWDVVLGDPETATPPADPFMIPSIDERSGQNPITGDPIVDSSSVDPLANAINGHERRIPNRDDLQYACIFRLLRSRLCPSGGFCDCSGDPSNPLCQPPDGGPAGFTQFFAKGYPGIRHLDVLKRFGKNGIAASICPKVIDDGETDLAFGYRPAISGLVKRLRCTGLDAEFERDPNSIDFGTVPCRLVAVRQTAGGCDCTGPYRLPIDEELRLEVAHALELRGVCGGTTSASCDTFCACEVPQVRKSALAACQNEPGETPIDPATQLPVDGWCYVDPVAGFGNPALIESCPPANFKNIRIVGAAVAAEGEELFVACPSGCVSPDAGAAAP